jgi:hypothetical protein
MVQGEITMIDQIIPKNRVLKIEEIGDFWRKRTKPRIRLKGKWLAEAGMQPNRYVNVSNPTHGVLVLHLIDNSG